MPRKSRALLENVPFEPHMARIKTPPGLDGVERELFERIVKQTSPMHFTESDAPFARRLRSSNQPCRFDLSGCTGKPRSPSGMGAGR